MIITNGTYKVYVHTNLINGKKYIGQTGLSLEVRAGSNGRKYKGCVHFYNAIQKYGWNNFSHEIVADNLTLEEANNFEELLIRKLNTQNPEIGYNLGYGGNNRQHTEETLQKFKYRKNGWAKPVVCDNIVFDSITKCARFYNVGLTSMKNWLRGKTTMPQKFIELGLHYVGDNCQYISRDTPQKIKTTHKAVLCEDKEFDSIKECADYYGVKYHTMVGWISGNKRMPQKFIEKNLRMKDKPMVYVAQIREREEV